MISAKCAERKKGEDDVITRHFIFLDYRDIVAFISRGRDRDVSDMTDLHVLGAERLKSTQDFINWLKVFHFFPHCIYFGSFLKGSVSQQALGKRKVNTPNGVKSHISRG